VDDLADAMVFLMDKYSELPHINRERGIEVTNKKPQKLVKERTLPNQMEPLEN
jgi:GDP-L-fucose synthase